METFQPRPSLCVLPRHSLRRASHQRPSFPAAATRQALDWRRSRSLPVWPWLSSVRPIISVFISSSNTTGLQTDIKKPSFLAFPGLFYSRVIGDEDNCLTLNVYTKGLCSDSNLEKRSKPEVALLPVLVWIHGGAFSIGSGADFLYGPHRAMNQDIVLVTINYRLGPFGFMFVEDGPRNIGLHDQRFSTLYAYTYFVFVFNRQPESKHCSTLRVEYGRNGSARAAWVLAV